MTEFRFKEYLKKKGFSFTPQRGTILEYISSQTTHFHAEDLIHSLKEQGVAVSRATVFRTLGHLQDAGLIRQVASDLSAGRYEFLGDNQHHEHMTCVKCGEVFEFHDKLLEQRIDSVAKKRCFTMSRHSVQIWGVCRSCNEQEVKGIAR
jgi:Fur family ferric uptake transcriptional regulator